MLIVSFLFIFVGKVIVANEKTLRNNLYLTDNVNIFVENVPGTTEKKVSNEVLVSYCCVPLALIRAFVLDSLDLHQASLACI